MTKSGPKVLEYNVRFGDPETQSLLALLESDLADLMLACTQGRLSEVELYISAKSAATVVIAAGGYPGVYAKGIEMRLDPVPEGRLLTGLARTTIAYPCAAGIVLFHAGTALVGNSLKTAGGRVIASTAIGDTLEEAVKKAYEGVGAIHFDKMQYRKDIAARALR